MKKYIFLVLLSFACAYSFESCNKASVDEPQNKIIELGNCTPVTQSSLPVICFDSLVDSRCPVGVLCPTAGFAVVHLSIKNNGGLTNKFSLSTLTGTHYPAPPNDTTLIGYHIKLINVFPYPDISVTNPINKVELQITY